MLHCESASSFEQAFPTVAAQDVGVAAASLLLDAGSSRVAPRIVSIEGKQRASALEVARMIGELSGREVAAHEVPRGDWAALLQGEGLSGEHARLVADLYDAHNAGRIDVEAGVGERRFGTTTLATVLAAIVPQATATAFGAQSRRLLAREGE